MSQDNNHDEWLSLIEISGPFLAVPALKKAFPQGLEAVDGRVRKYLRQAYDEWCEARDNDDPQLEELHRAWIHEVLARGLEYDENDSGESLKRGEAIPPTLHIALPEHGVTLSPDYALVNGQKTLLLIQTYPVDTDLDSAISQQGWVATPAERMVQLCRITGCRLGLITNGERWLLIDAPVGSVVTYAGWYARLWGQEPLTLQAFLTLLGIRRFFVDTSEQLPALFDESLQHQEEVTDALGEQVRRAVEVLIQSLDKEDLNSARTLLQDVAPTQLYEAGLTIMMRLVFLLSAEERGLLLMGDAAYEANYAISTLRMQLRKESDEVLERRHDAWARLLATFRAVYGGIEHEALRLPALGGSLFDPDRFPFLEGRPAGSSWRTDDARPLPIDNRTVLLLLEAIQQYQGRTLSYRALDVEQIGYVYEGLLERTVKRTDAVTVELVGGKGAKKTIHALSVLEALRGRDEDEFTRQLACSDALKRAESAIRKDLVRVVDATLTNHLLTACHGDEALRDRLLPIANLLRTDPWGYPLVYAKGAFIVTTGSDRRETGTHYTPKSLTEAIVAETLTPVVYVGPAEGASREQWALKSPAELLDLKICDPAMGSGAFLVQTCRWLSDRLVESWSQAEATGKNISVDGKVLDEPNKEEHLPRDSEARMVIARRLIAERCLYGIDLNPLAVELAKLSIWLVTLAKGRPFGFLDHNLRCGDSLLGIHRLDQLTELSMTPGGKGQQRLFGNNIEKAAQEAIVLRQRLREIPIRDIHDVEAMARLDADARRKLEVPEHIANAFIGAVLASGGNGNAIGNSTASLAIQAGQAINGDRDAITSIARRAVTALATDTPSDKPGRKPFHWPLEFPEVFTRGGGFDCIVGNPPFLGGQKITGAMGDCYREHLVNNIADGRRGSADFVAYFFIRVNSLLGPNGFFGLIAVNSISEGNTREVGLDSILKSGSVIYKANPNLVWPGEANVVTSSIYVSKKMWNGPLYILDRRVSAISSALTQRENWQPVKLKASCGLVYQGAIILSEGFFVDDKTYSGWQAEDSESCSVVYDYLIGKEVNQSPRHLPGRKVIGFLDWSEEQSAKFKSAFDYVVENVKPEREKDKDKGARELWWRFLRPRPELFHLLGRGHAFQKHPKGWNQSKVPLERVIVFATGATKYPCFTLVPNTYMYAHTLCVVASESYSLFACLSSDIHVVWAWEHGSRMKQDLRYTHGDIFETFPFPSRVLDGESKLLSELGEEFFNLRSNYMVENNKGMTKFYNDLHDPANTNSAVQQLRELQSKINQAVIDAYGFDELDLELGFHEVAYLPEGKNTRFTISESVREGLLYRLAMLNKERYELESVSAPTMRGAGKATSRARISDEAMQGSLFGGAGL
ncbi:Eco57I restriction-modification methylase domain-containing protein [Pseudomonas fluorescens]|uniref:Eco57I restriction-modification methylase domain-containing protein n=1 Tax=Pseudomonas fluorescens TaxID=294 RepID=UPI003D1F2233